MIENKIIQILKTIIKKKINYKNSKKIVSDGYLDSFSILILISKLERSFNIKIKLENFDINQFNSVSLIKKIISKSEKK